MDTAVLETQETMEGLDLLPSSESLEAEPAEKPTRVKKEKPPKPEKEPLDHSIAQMEVNYLRTKPPLEFFYRQNTTDLNAIMEVVRRNDYFPRQRIPIEPTDVWLDLGGNIGAFAKLVLHLGASHVISVEPEDSNLELLLKNTEGLNVTIIPAAVVPRTKGDAPTVDLYLCSTSRNKYRHTLFPMKNRQTVEVRAVTLKDLLETYKPNAIKMDIEGAELALLDSSTKWPGVKKMVFEYHFDHDRPVANFWSRMERLKSQGFTLTHSSVPTEGTYDVFPSSRIVWAVRD